MYDVFVIVKVKPGLGDAFLAAAKRNRGATRHEPGNIRFDVLKAPNPSSDPEDPELFYLFEVYQTFDDYAAHRRTEHYNTFRDDVEELMAEPRQGITAVEVYADSWS